MDSAAHSAADALLLLLLQCKVVVIKGNKRCQAENRTLTIVVVEGTALFLVLHKLHTALEVESCTSDEFYLDNGLVCTHLVTTLIDIDQIIASATALQNSQIRFPCHLLVDTPMLCWDLYLLVLESVL